MRPIIALALVAATTLAACGGAGTGGNGPPAAGAPTAATDGTAAPSAATAPGDATPAAAATAATAGADDASGLAKGPTPTTDPTVVALVEGFEPPAIGADDALITIYEFSDFLCPYCRQFSEETYQQVKAAYVDTGRARLVFWHLPLKNHGWPAVVGAEASLCAGDQGRFWEMHDRLFASWKALSELPVEDEAKAREAMFGIADDLAADASLDVDAFRACLEATKYRPVVSVLTRQALEDLKINATPSFLIQAGEHFELVAGFLPFEDMRKVLDREISRAQGTPIPTDTATPPATGTAAP